MPATILKSVWSSGNLAFRQRASTSDGAVNFGEDDIGVNVNMYGATSGVVLAWDQSADVLIASGADLQFKGALSAPFDFNGATNYFADFSGAGVAGISLTADGMSQDPETASEDGFLTILVGASTYEIPIYLNT